MDSIRSISRSSTHGPFLDERDISGRLACGGSSAASLLAAASAADDVTVGLLALLAGAVADRRHAPGRLRMVAQRPAALAAAVRMVDRVHGLAARLRAHTEVALAAGLADGDVLVVGVADHADGRAAL